MVSRHFDSNSFRVHSRHFTNDHRVLNRASWSLRQAGRMLLGWLLTALMSPGATIVLGADDTVARRCGRRITAKGCDRDAVRSSQTHVIRCFGLTWVSMRLLVPVPWSQRVWALPCLTALCWPAQKGGRRRHQTSIDWVRHMLKQVRRWRPGQRLVLVVDGGFAAVSLALAGVTHHVVMVSRLRWEAALSHPPEPQPPGKRGRKPTKGPRQRRLQAWANRRDTPWETVEVDWYGGQRTTWWVFSHTALWYTPGLPPVDMRYVLVADPEGKRRLEAFFCTDLWATPVEILPWVVMRWSVEVTCEEARIHLGVETPRQWSDRAIARTTPVLLGLFSLVTVLALRWSGDGQIPVPVTAWYHTAEPTFADGLAVVRQHLWRARYVVNSGAEPEFVPCPRAALELLLTGLPLAA
jgi:DDE superfamily endonuclease